MSPRARREVLAVDPDSADDGVSGPGGGPGGGDFDDGGGDFDGSNSPGGDGFGPRVVDPAASDGVEEAEEVGLRPRSLSEFLGQPQLVEHLGIVLQAARQRRQPVDHILFAGPPGLGKTSLAGIVAAEMGAGFRITSGPVLTRAGDLAALLTDLQDGDVLFIDEIHRLHRSVEEMLYSAMEDGRLDILIGKGPTARSIRLELPSFTLVGATTRTGLVAAPLRDRFGFVGRLDLYEPADLRAIVERSARILKVIIDDEGAIRISERSRGTPRVANRLLRRVRDFAEVRGDGIIDGAIASDGLELFGVDELGLDKVDRAILATLCQRFGGQPVGLTTLAQCVGEETDTIEDAYEPFLLQSGLIQRTSRGRVATLRAWAHLGLERPASAADARNTPPLF
ncbi:MAG TPA: Holliday junction branch migration DNA helicase RuvB [Acidimicrobiales bacterium]